MIRINAWNNDIGMVASQAFPDMSAFFCVLTGYEFTLCFQDLRFLKADSRAHT